MSSAAPAPASNLSACDKFAKSNGFFLLRRLQSLCGIAFGGYILIHLLVNATLIQGTHPDIYQEQVDKIHSLPFLLGVELATIFLPIIIHTVYGFYVIAQGKPNVGEYNYVKNWFYVMQRVTAIGLVLFILFHVGAMWGWFGHGLKFDEHEATRSTIHHLRSSPLLWLIVYPLGILFATFHMANGFWTGAISWGLTVSKKAQARWGWVCIAIFAFSTACGFIALIGAFTSHPPHPLIPQLPPFEMPR